MGARNHVAIVAGFTVLAAVLRFATLDVQSFGPDEAATAENVLNPNFGEMWDRLGDTESTPPLYYVTAWFWSKLFGLGEVGLRSLSALIGTALVPVAYMLGAKVASRRVGVVLCALVAVNPMLVWFSQEARAYSLLALTSTASVLLFVYALESPTRRRLGLWAVTAALTLATHYFGVFIVAAEAVWLLASRREIRNVGVAIGAVVVAGLALAPLAADQAATNRTSWIAELPLDHRLSTTANTFLVGPSGAQLAYVIPIAAALVGVGLGLLAWRADGRERYGAGVGAVLGLAVVLMPLGLALVGEDELIEKNLLPALVPLMLVVAAGLGARRAGLPGAAVTVGLCAVSVLVVIRVAESPDLQRPDYRGAAQVIRAGSSAAVVGPGNAGPPLRLYLGVNQMWQANALPPVDEVVVVGPWNGAHVSRSFAHFEPTELRDFGEISVARLHSSRPRRLPRALARLHPGSLSLMLYETPQGSSSSRSASTRRLISSRVSRTSSIGRSLGSGRSQSMYRLPGM